MVSCCSSVSGCGDPVRSDGNMNVEKYHQILNRHWPPQSPDLSIDEAVWDYLDRDQSSR